MHGGGDVGVRGQEGDPVLQAIVVDAAAHLIAVLVGAVADEGQSGVAAPVPEGAKHVQGEELIFIGVAIAHLQQAQGLGAVVGGEKEAALIVAVGHHTGGHVRAEGGGVGQGGAAHQGGGMAEDAAAAHAAGKPGKRAGILVRRPALVGMGHPDGDAPTVGRRQARAHVEVVMAVDHVVVLPRQQPQQVAIQAHRVQQLRQAAERAGAGPPLGAAVDGAAVGEELRLVEAPGLRVEQQVEVVFLMETPDDGHQHGWDAAFIHAAGGHQQNTLFHITALSGRR